MLIAVVLAAVLLVSGCGSSRTTQATHLTPSQIQARAMRKDVQRMLQKGREEEAPLPPNAAARLLRQIQSKEFQRDAQAEARALTRLLRYSLRAKH
jgi:hypothetical protein